MEQCVAPQEVVMIDCCRSGGFAVGLRASDQQPDGAVAKCGESALLTSRSVYVVSSSRAGENSYADAGQGADVTIYQGSSGWPGGLRGWRMSRQQRSRTPRRPGSWVVRSTDVVAHRVASS